METNPTPETREIALRILELAEKATPGPWIWETPTGGRSLEGESQDVLRTEDSPAGYRELNQDVMRADNPDDLVFIAEIRTLAPALAEIVAKEPIPESTTAAWLKDALAALQKIAEGHPYPAHHADGFLKRVKDSESFRPDCWRPFAAVKSAMDETTLYQACHRGFVNRPELKKSGGVTRAHMEHRIGFYGATTESDWFIQCDHLGTPRAIEPPPSGLEVRND